MFMREFRLNKMFVRDPERRVNGRPNKMATIVNPFCNGHP
jgi:hypothetical protein